MIECIDFALCFCIGNFNRISWIKFARIGIVIVGMLFCCNHIWCTVDSSIMGRETKNRRKKIVKKWVCGLLQVYTYPSWLLWKISIFDERCAKMCFAFCLLAKSNGNWHGIVPGIWNPSNSNQFSIDCERKCYRNWNWR